MLILSVSRYHCGLLVSHNDGRWDSGVYTNTDFVVHTNKSSQHGQKVCDRLKSKFKVTLET